MDNITVLITNNSGKLTISDKYSININKQMKGNSTMNAEKNQNILKLIKDKYTKT